jgi:hypothetical protein
MSTIKTKSKEIAEKTLSIDHSVNEGKSLLIGERDTQGKMRILLEIEVATNYIVNIKGIITDKEISPP